MQQQISVITLGVADLARSRRFYVEGFGWKPVFESPDIIFFQMNGLMLGLWKKDQLAADMKRDNAGVGNFGVAHNVARKDDVQPAIDRLLKHGGRLLRAPDVPPPGGLRGYVADPDDHPWEIAWNPAWPISPEGYVTFAA